MKPHAALLLALSLLTGAAHAGQMLMEIRGEALFAAASQGSAEIISPSSILIRSRGAVSQKFPLLVLSEPGITQDRFALTGRVRHTLSGRGYFEMVAEFANGEQVLIRHSDEEGPRSTLVGTGDWREFTLPFYLNDASLGLPNSISLNVILPFRGTVVLDSLRLVEFTPEDDVLAFSGQWWSPPASLMLISASAMGFLLCFSMIALLARQGSARTAVWALLAVLTGVGASLVGLGVVALRDGQPSHVTHPLLALGAIVLGVSLLAAPRVAARYRETELRRMRALDAH